MSLSKLKDKRKIFKNLVIKFKYFQCYDTSGYTGSKIK